MDAEYFQFVTALLQILEACKARYAIGGSLASSVYGEIRATYDIDLSIQLSLKNVPQFVEALEQKQWLFTAERILYAVQTGTDFQLIDQNGGLKADCYAVHSPPTLSQQRILERVRQLPYGYQEKTASFMSPEDVILYKLDWYMQGKSEKHLRDIAAMLKVQGEALDYAYINEWVDEARNIWNRLAEEYRKRET